MVYHLSTNYSRKHRTPAPDIVTIDLKGEVEESESEIETSDIEESESMDSHGEACATSIDYNSDASGTKYSRNLTLIFQVV